MEYHKSIDLSHLMMSFIPHHLLFLFDNTPINNEITLKTILVDILQKQQLWHVFKFGVIRVPSWFCLIQLWEFHIYFTQGVLIYLIFGHLELRTNFVFRKFERCVNVVLLTFLRFWGGAVLHLLHHHLEGFAWRAGLRAIAPEADAFDRLVVHRLWSLLIVASISIEWLGLFEFHLLGVQWSQFFLDFAKLVGHILSNCQILL